MKFLEWCSVSTMFVATRIPAMLGRFAFWSMRSRSIECAFDTHVSTWTGDRTRTRRSQWRT